jgi:putative transposase
MKQRCPRIALRCLCVDVGKTRQGYYERSWQQEHVNTTSKSVVQLVQRERQQLPRLGTRKLYHVLKPKFERGALKVGRDTLFTILRENGLLVRRKRKYVKTTNSKHWMKKYSNLMKNVTLERPEQVFVSDITYINTETGFSYLSLVTDACSKKIMGHALSTNLGLEGSVSALRQALSNRITDKPLIHHSDRGYQYCSKEYVSILQENQIQISMTNNGDPYENAIAERVNGILKDEFYCSLTFSTYEQAERHIDEAIWLYNNKRPHLSCKMRTPERAHKLTSLIPKQWKTKKGIHSTNVCPISPT